MDWHWALRPEFYLQCILSSEFGLYCCALQSRIAWGRNGFLSLSVETAVDHWSYPSAWRGFCSVNDLDCPWFDKSLFSDLSSATVVRLSSLVRTTKLAFLIGLSRCVCSVLLLVWHIYTNHQNKIQLQSHNAPKVTSAVIGQLTTHFGTKTHRLDSSIEFKLKLCIEVTNNCREIDSKIMYMVRNIFTVHEGKRNSSYFVFPIKEWFH